jgi:meiotically up-regulated gene 157 (Mug157) protein
MFATLRRSLVILLVAALIDGTASAAPTGLSADVTSKLDTLYAVAAGQTIGRHVIAQRDGTTYVSTGDIDAEWLRDASATVRPLIARARTDRAVAASLHGVMERMARYILIDPYANAFYSNYAVAERKFEVDSLLYPIWFAAEYVKQTGDSSILTPTVRRAFQSIIATLRTEQHHAARSRYTNPQLARGGRGSAVAYTGMVWTGFRPSDDPARYHYNIPDNMFAVVVLRQLSTLSLRVLHDGPLAAHAWGMSSRTARSTSRRSAGSMPTKSTAWATRT